MKCTSELITEKEGKGRERKTRGGEGGGESEEKEEREKGNEKIFLMTFAVLNIRM